MSIKEALGRIQGEPGAMPTRGQGAWNEREIAASYGAAVFEKGLAIQEEAHVPELLGELAKIIRPEFWDVKAHETLMPNGVLSLGIEWNFRDRPGRNTSFLKYEYNSLYVEAYPSTGNVVVRGQEGAELLTKDQWMSDRNLIEDAIVRAYRNPIITAGPPGRR